MFGRMRRGSAEGTAGSPSRITSLYDLCHCVSKSARLLRRKATKTPHKISHCTNTSLHASSSNSPNTTTSLGVFWLSAATREISEKMAATSFKYALSRSARLSDPRNIVSACRANSYTNHSSIGNNNSISKQCITTMLDLWYPFQLEHTTAL